MRTLRFRRRKISQEKFNSMKHEREREQRQEQNKTGGEKERRKRLPTELVKESVKLPESRETRIKRQENEEKKSVEE